MAWIDPYTIPSRNQRTIRAPVQSRRYLYRSCLFFHWMRRRVSLLPIYFCVFQCQNFIVFGYHRIIHFLNDAHRLHNWMRAFLEAARNAYLGGSGAINPVSNVTALTHIIPHVSRSSPYGPKTRHIRHSLREACIPHLDRGYVHSELDFQQVE